MSNSCETNKGKIYETRLHPLVCLGLGILVGAANGISIYTTISNRLIPSQSIVQEGYIAPSRLEVDCQDLDGNGEDETTLRIDDKSYLLREIDGTPELSTYSISPREIIIDNSERGIK